MIYNFLHTTTKRIYHIAYQNEQGVLNIMTINV